MEHFIFFSFQSEAQKKLEEIKQFRERMKEVADDARKKDELQKQLVSKQLGLWLFIFLNVSELT